MELQNNVNRGEFLRQLGLGSKALMAFYCLGAVSACSTESPEPAGMNNPPMQGGSGTPPADSGVVGTTSGSSVNFTIDLTNASFVKLKTAGEFSYIADIIVINSSSAGFVALSKVCTHAGTRVNFRKDQNDIMCPNHGSEFRLDGTVKRSPASTPLTMYKTAVSMDGNTLTVKS